METLPEDLRTLKRLLLVYALLGLVLWPVPLLNILHVESAAVVALVAFFGAGLSSLRLFQTAPDLGLRGVLVRQEAALLVPWVLLTVSLLWAPNCGYLQGLLFYGLFPGISVVLAVALTYALSATVWRGRRAAFIGTGLAILVLGPVYDLGLHPQFYTYNHVFGGVLGPIYDEELAMRPGLFAFRGLTLLWAMLAVLIGLRLRQRKSRRAGDRRSKTDDRFFLLRLPSSPRAVRWAMAGIGLLIVACYTFAGPLGINTPVWYLQRALGGQLQTEHFNIYYDPASLTPHELRLLAEDHEYRYHWLAERLQMDVEGRIDSYLYPSPEVKARLTGARYTSVAPVWLPAPQSHVLLDAYGNTFGHELVHVFSRAFGMPVLNASFSVGLVEGLAEALEPPDGRPGLHEQVAAAVLEQTGREADRSLVDQVAGRLTPFGFWTGRGAISYTTMGSFVRYLLDAYGPEPLKAVYAWADFEDVYGRPIAVLVQEWERFLWTQPVVARAAAPLVEARFAIPSLFETRCPHYVPSFQRRYRAGEAALVAGDTTEALHQLEAALAVWPTYPLALDAWAQVRLARGAPADVVARLDTLVEASSVPSLALRLGDAYTLLGQPPAARLWYGMALQALPLYAHEARAYVALRTGLADRAGAVRILVSGDSAHVQARRLRALPDPEPAVAAAAGLRFLEAARYAEAAPRLYTDLAAAAQWLPSAEAGILQRQRLVWLAELAYRAGIPGRAAAYAQAAAQAFREVGALNEAAALEDRAAKARWMAAQRAPLHAAAKQHAGTLSAGPRIY